MSARGRPRPRILLLAGLCCAVLGAPGNAGPRWWRLACNSSLAEEWRVCGVWLYSDRSCRLAPPAALELRFSSPASFQRAGIANMVFQEWASACTSCEPGDAFLGARFSAPVVVQCLAVSECPAAATTPTTAQSSPRSACEQVVLERSDDNLSWDPVGAWTWPWPEEHLSLDNSSFQPPEEPPRALAWEPAADANCGSCGRVGLDAVQTLELNFSKPIYHGDGSVTLERGSLGRLSLNPVWQLDWFQVEGPRLQIRPQEPLASPASCTQVSLEPSAFVDADGQPMVPPAPFVSCVGDLEAPVLQSTEPPNGTSSVDLQPLIRLSFSEGVQVLPSAPPAMLEPEVAEGTAQASELRFVAAAGDRALEANASGLLAPDTAYRIAIPAGLAADAAGNAWPGALLRFTTGCGEPGGCAPPAGAGGGGGGGGSQAEASLVAEDEWANLKTGLIATGVLLAVGSVAFVCWFAVKMKLESTGPDAKPADEPTAEAEPSAQPPGGQSTPPRVAWAADDVAPGAPAGGAAPGPRAPEVDVEAPSESPQTSPRSAAGQPAGAEAEEEDRQEVSSPRLPNQASPSSSPRSPPHTVPEEGVAAKEEEELDLDRVKAQLVIELCQTQREDLASRKKRYKALCLQWHPDKNQGRRLMAEEVFKFLQEQRPHYLWE